MGYNRANGGAEIVRVGLNQLGKPYSEESPPGSDGDGHFWVPGDPVPTYFDCSGLVHYATTVTGCPSNPGSANDQWVTAGIWGVRLTDSDFLCPGDIACFMGSEDIEGYAGHTGIVVSYDNKANRGVLVNAYDTDTGVITLVFTRSQLTNGDNGLGWIGAYRIANLLPEPPQRFVSGMTWSPNVPGTDGDWLIYKDHKAGIPGPAQLKEIESARIPMKKRTKEELDALTSVEWGYL